MYKLNELFTDHQLYHSEFQQDFFITARSGGTLYGMYKQAVRELYKRWRGLKEIYTQKDLLKVDLDELEFKIKHSDGTPFELRRNRINFDKKTGDMSELQKNIADTEREFKRFYQQSCALKNQLGDLTDAKRNQYDVEMWHYKLKEMAALDLISSGRVQKNTLECILACPIEIKNQLLLDIKDHNSLIEWIERKAEVLQIESSDLASIEMPNIKLLEG